MWSEIKKTLSIQLIFLIVGFLIVLLSNEGDFYKIGWNVLFQNIGFLLISIGIVSFIYRIIIKKEEKENVERLMKEVSEKVNQRLLFNSNILDSGLIRVEKEFLELRKYDEIQGEYLVLNTYIPSYYDKQNKLREKISDGSIEKMNIHLLDTDKEPGNGLDLIKLRAETLDGDFDFYKSEILNNYRQIKKIAEDLKKGDLNNGNLKEFNLYLYNIMPALFGMKFCPEEIYMTFFFFRVKANSSPQLVIDAKNKNSLWNRSFQTHISELRIHHNTKKFNLLKDEGIKELNDYIEKIKTESNKA